jgi:hypothetical protein
MWAARRPLLSLIRHAWKGSGLRSIHAGVPRVRGSNEKALCASGETRRLRGGFLLWRRQDVVGAKHEVIFIVTRSLCPRIENSPIGRRVQIRQATFILTGRIVELIRKGGEQ